MEELFQMPGIVGARLDEVNFFLGKLDHLCGVHDSTQLLEVVDMLSRLAYYALLVKTLLMLGVNHEIVHTEGELFQSLKDLLFTSSLRNLPINQLV